VNLSEERQTGSHVSLSITKYIEVDDTELTIEETVWTTQAGTEPSVPVFNLNGEPTYTLKLEILLTRRIQATSVTSLQR
jgi:hypothetical protein